MMIRPLRLYLLLVGVHAGQLLFYAPRLPDVVPSHFDASGEPDGWMSKAVFLAFLGGVSALYLAAFFGAALLAARAPAAVVNLPNKAYWLAPERAAATRRAIVAELFRIAAVTQALQIVVTQLTVEVGLGRRQTLSDVFNVALAVYFGVVGWRVIALYRRFRRVGDGSTSEPS